MPTLRTVFATRTFVRLALATLTAALLPCTSAAPLELKTLGNQIVLKSTGAPVRLTGVNIPSLEWLVNGQISYGDHLIPSLITAAGDWDANIVRLPVTGTSWISDATYRSTVISFIDTASSAGVYVILDLHGYYYPTTQDTAFWTSAATQFKNNPAVLFGLFNEPSGTTQAEWRNGKNGGPGIQGLLNAVRATGANNVVLAGALGSAFKVRDIIDLGYTLTDTASGNGVVYDAHIYPWSGSAQYWVGTAMQTHPVLIGEIGHPDGTTFDNHGTFEDDASWVPKLLDWADTHNAHWTGWCLYPGADPRMISDWNYTPTAFWGAPAKARLLGYRNPNTLRVLGGTVMGTTGTNASPASGVLTDYQRGAVAPFGDNLDNGSYYFDGPMPTNSWTGLDLRQAFRIEQIKYMPRQAQGALMVGGVFQASNQANFSGAVTLHTITQAPNDSRATVQATPAIYTGVYTTASVTNTGTYRYVRYVGPSGSRCNVAKIRFLGKGLFGGSTTPEIVIDNTASSGVAITGEWTAGYAGSYLGSNYLHDGNTGKGTKSVRYTPTITVAGNYQIFARWAASSNRATNVPIDIVTPSGGTATVVVNQQQNDGQWYSLGTYSLPAGTSASVLIRTTGTNGYVIADAIRFAASP